MTQAFALLGIHTDVGKTVCAAILTETLGCDYWKPIQAGTTESTDRERVSTWVNNSYSTIHPEAYLLRTPCSPHAAARMEGIYIDMTKLGNLPTDKPLLIETAGGVMSPINDECVVADWIAHFKWPAVLVVSHYLGSISHTLSAIESIRSRGITLLGLIFNGSPHPESEQLILNYTKAPLLGRIPQLKPLDAQHIALVAQEWRAHLPEALKPWYHTQPL